MPIRVRRIRETDNAAWERKEPVPYEEYGTGLTFTDVYHMIWNRRWKRRNGVLGAWREIKRKMYREYLEKWERWQETRG